MDTAEALRSQVTQPEAQTWATVWGLHPPPTQGDCPLPAVSSSPFRGAQVPPSHVPCRVTRSSHQPGAGCPLCPGEPLWCQVEETRGTRGASLMRPGSQNPPTDFVALMMGPGEVQGPAGSPATHLIPALPPGESICDSVLAARRGCLFTRPSQHRGLSRAGPSQDMELTWAGTQQCMGLRWAAPRPPGHGALLCRHPGKRQHKGTAHTALSQSAPQPLSTSEQDVS